MQVFEHLFSLQLSSEEVSCDIYIIFWLTCLLDLLLILLLEALYHSCKFSEDEVAD